MNKLTVDFQQVFEAPGIPSETQVQKWAQLAWQGEDPSEVTVRIVGTEESQALNHQYRGRDYATNVLSFPAFPVAIGDPLPPLLGDVILASETVEREARLEGKVVQHHISHLVIHGLLHLLGYDHENEEDAEVMEAIERSALARLAIPDPYA